MPQIFPSPLAGPLAMLLQNPSSAGGGIRAFHLLLYFPELVSRDEYFSRARRPSLRVSCLDSEKQTDTHRRYYVERLDEIEFLCQSVDLKETPSRPIVASLECNPSADRAYYPVPMRRTPEMGNFKPGSGDARETDGF